MGSEFWVLGSGYSLTASTALSALTALPGCPSCPPSKLLLQAPRSGGILPPAGSMVKRKARHRCVTLVMVGSLLFIALAATRETAAQDSAFRGLDYGPYAVGFRIESRPDHSREYLGPGDAAGYGSRPQQIAVWYPAQRPAGKPAMRFEEYVLARALEEFSGTSSQAQRTETLAWFRKRPLALGAVESDLNRLLASPTRAWKDAPRRSGRFPLVIYAHNETFEKSVLAEYLASHGFVVASLPVLGTYERDLDVGVTGLETEIRDLETLLDRPSSDPRVDPRRIAVVGMSFGALSALGLAMRHPGVDAVVSLDGGVGSATDPYMLQQSDFYALERARAPLLHVYGIDVPGTDLTFLRSLKYSERWLVGFSGMRHGDFAGYGILTSQTPNILGPGPADIPSTTAWAFWYVRHFLQAFLRGDAKSMEVLGRSDQELGTRFQLVVERQAALPAAPYPEQMKRLVLRQGFDSLLRLYDGLHRADPQPISQEAFRLLGVWLLDNDRAADAQQWFRLQTEDYPTSARAHYYYAAASLRANDSAAARDHFNQALSLLPGDVDLDAPTRSRLESRARTALERLEKKD